jgi:hypothetical protein
MPVMQTFVRPAFWIFLSSLTLLTLPARASSSVTPMHIYAQEYHYKPYVYQNTPPWPDTVIACMSYINQIEVPLVAEDKPCLDAVSKVIAQTLKYNPNFERLKKDSFFTDIEVMHILNVDANGTISSCWDSFTDETHGNKVILAPDHLFVRVNCDKDTWHSEEKIRTYLHQALDIQ